MTNPIAVSQRAREMAADIWRDYAAKVGEVIVERCMRDGGLDEGLPSILARFEAEIRADERERSAKVAEDHGFTQVDFGEPSDPNQPGIFGKTTFDNRRGNEASIATAIRNQKDHDHE